jgi:hypothetical protein
VDRGIEDDPLADVVVASDLAHTEARGADIGDHIRLAPDPHESILLDRSVGGGVPRSILSVGAEARDLEAAPLSVKLPAMIGALEPARLDTAQRQRNVSMGTAVHQSADSAEFISKQH